MDCLFCKIAAGEIPSDIVYEDDKVLAFRDIAPQAPTHCLIIPRTHIATLNDLDEDGAALVGYLTLVASRLAASEGIADAGYRLNLNCNEHGGQSVHHIHLHLLGGRQMGWPPG